MPHYSHSRKNENLGSAFFYKGGSPAKPDRGFVEAEEAVLLVKNDACHSPRRRESS